MEFLTYKQLIEQLQANDLVTVHIAHTYEYGSYRNYSQTVYKVLSTGAKGVHLQNAKYPSEYLIIDEKSIETNQFKVQTINK